MNAIQKIRYTKMEFMKIFSRLLFVFFISFFTYFWLTTPVIAFTKTVLEKTFVRDTGKPTTETVVFTVPIVGEGKLKIVNGPNGEKRISSANISLNGKEIIGPDKFNQNVATIEVPVQLVKGDNTLSATLKSNPGGSVFIQITIDIPGPLVPPPPDVPPPSPY